MKFVKITTVLLSLIALLTGAMDVIVGVAGQANIGVGTAAVAPFDPVLDSQVRFLGAVWLGLGAIQLVCLGDLRRYGLILQLCFAIVVLGGIGRALSLLQAGHPSSDIGTAFIAVALAIELLLVPLAWLAFRRATLAADEGFVR
ncbi:DUF4345 domain-containing protein [Sphingopyxis sp. USTB-05]|uniref:DUF4345 domain-containing protein n=1 Tax=Sphingopyxis sp. USTB-05 TaxID=2830667 RepID=UPI0020788517|nr:DUF4345 domain-containing protein [Sphingopyxis sp. USTB-05]USI77678.1 DUF4345 domain-containing protein [Sphingopyxis sp. USTB-05]